MSLNPSDALLAHTLNSITSSLQVLSSLNLLSEADSSLIRSKLPSPNALSSSSSSQQSHHTLSPSPSNASYNNNNNNNNASSPYPAPIYGHGNSNDSSSSFGGGGGGGAHRVPPPLPGRSYPGLGEARAVWDYHGGAPDDLIFKKDDVIMITEEMNPEWFKGHLSTDTSPTPRIGLFPSTYVTKLPPNSRGQAPGDYKQDNNAPYSQYNNNSNQGYHSPSPPIQQFQQMAPYQPPPQQVYQQQPGPVVQAAPAKPPGKFDGMGKLLATSAVGGVGFGAGSAVGSSLIHAIF